MGAWDEAMGLFSGNGTGLALGLPHLIVLRMGMSPMTLVPLELSIMTRILSVVSCAGTPGSSLKYFTLMDMVP